MNPKVSIIVPVYKCENFLGEMLHSLLQQTLPDIQIILVDDGSPDNSGMICDEYAQRDERIIVIHQENQGAGIARNAGLDKATGDYIGFCDSDDWVDINMYESMYQQALSKHADIVRCNTLSHETWGDRVTWCPDYTNKILDAEFIKSIIMPMMIAPEKEAEFNKRLLKGCVCCIFKHDMLDKYHVRFKNIRNGQDYIFTSEAMWVAESLVLMNEPFYHYRRQSSGSLSLSMNKFRNYNQRHASRAYIESLVKGTKYYPIYQNRWEQEDRRFVYLDVRIATIYNTSNDDKRKLSLIKEVLNSDECKEAYSKPIGGKLPFQLKVLYYLISHKHSWLLYKAINYKFNKKDE